MRTDDIMSSRPVFFQRCTQPITKTIAPPPPGRNVSHEPPCRPRRSLLSSVAPSPQQFPYPLECGKSPGITHLFPIILYSFFLPLALPYLLCFWCFSLSLNFFTHNSVWIGGTGEGNARVVLLWKVFVQGDIRNYRDGFHTSLLFSRSTIFLVYFHF